MTTDWRTLCFELTEALCGYEVTDQDVALIDRTRAALAEPEPEPEGPTDDELFAVAEAYAEDNGLIGLHNAPDFARAVLARWGTPNLTETRSSLKDAWAAHQPAIEAAAKAGMDACRVDGPAVPDGREPASVAVEASATDLLKRQAVGLAARPLIEQVAALGDCISEQTVGQVIALADRASAWLAENPPGQPIAIEPRGCPTPGACSCVTQRQSAPESAGEVAELVAALRNDAINCTCSTLTSGDLRRAADILEQRQAAQVPVPVSERLPGREDCDAEGECWWYGDGEDMVGWTFQDLEGLSYYKATHWLPAHALPLPTTETRP